jgi:hypothetical protein
MARLLRLQPVMSWMLPMSVIGAGVGVLVGGLGVLVGVGALAVGVG